MKLSEERIRQFAAICDALSDEDDSMKREILTHTGNRWSLGIVYALGTQGTLRHAGLARELSGITQRMLTRTLRQLERDGLISRHDYQQKYPHPRVEYTLTALGEGMLLNMLPLWNWLMDNAAGFRAARSHFAASHPADSVP
ncbi:helix-turn-helix transcriptional regulator [Erwiniaceae bacterium BAC15a-03b]|uniref:Helix-turn-helix transcriptional regulator n=1 Tax=Winslowiella arboricola TaxID=2978220 RepID=A0A9J6PR54_9GAMM|nr:helix-turn-helix domain-containing protein [Winslowiella arboricola]MCU5773320.1 helix-turn-helix transcriptional regulator [Winslowiella arboricola]MCU5779206.1 helix-turn-helix transcriptional regulator [Winslowiella arboricola]